jgi:hypothetical protein
MLKTLLLCGGILAAGAGSAHLTRQAAAERAFHVRDAEAAWFDALQDRTMLQARVGETLRAGRCPTRRGHLAAGLTKNITSPWDGAPRPSPVPGTGM